jgi:hypothetical protein
VIQETLGPVLNTEELEQLRLLTTKISAGLDRPS